MRIQRPRLATGLIPALFIACVPSVAIGESAAFDSAIGDDPSPWSVEYELSLQLIREREDVFAPLGGGEANRSAAELRLNVQLQCDRGACQDTRLVLKPRLSLDDDERPRDMPDPQPDALAEGYLLQSLGEGQLGLGKRLLGWGPSLLYSPTNRLFPDNGAATPRRDIPGKPMAFASMPLSPRGRLNLLVADPRLDEVDGIRRGGAFGLARAEWNWVQSQITTLGAVAGGGGGLHSYFGGYVQHGLDDAWTLGAEAAASRGYARRASSGVGEEPLAQNENRWHWDGTLNLRYGASSGAEIGLELIYNGYAMSDSEVANPLIAAMPSAGSSPSRNRPLHPFVQRRYALLQGTWPKLFGDRRWGLTARVLQGLEQSSTDSFLELSFSPTDTSTLYLGHAHSRVPESLLMSRPVPRSTYVAMELFF
ncbi:hypothetical protein P8H27_18955 [Pseudomonas sp. sp1636]|uniref:hypothetical protein n=1 Tax=Pseudomonas sp. sp1636 TaxID=3036707 RepID=UPI0025A62E0E|nr:hypothetical protein [Pseudomonas sp. sp1636]MDM8350960.1 hypothetical protein [Pseudomonas sp. sp1636]